MKRFFFALLMVLICIPASAQTGVLTYHYDENGVAKIDSVANPKPVTTGRATTGANYTTAISSASVTLLSSVCSFDAPAQFLFTATDTVYVYRTATTATATVTASGFPYAAGSVWSYTFGTSTPVLGITTLSGAVVTLRIEREDLR